MRKGLIIGAVIVVVGGAAVWFGLMRREQTAAAAGDPSQPQQGRGGGGMGGFGGPGGGFGGPGGGAGRGFRPPMTVEMAKVGRGRITATLTVVGNLIGEQTVDVAPRVNGRITSINVKLGDRVRRGQVIAKIEDREIVEQLNQAQASHQVAEANIRQREADLNLAKTNVERSRNLFSRQLLPKQTLDDAEARYTAAVAQVDVSNAQLAQSQARLQELKINLSNTTVTSPVDGFVAKRNLDVGGFASQNTPVVGVVDISSLRLVANVVEKDLRAVSVGDRAEVEVDAYPGEKFAGRIARLAPVLDPATRTAAMEVEVPNAQFRLKPGMYARVELTIEDKENAIVIPKIALVDSEGRRGVFMPNEQNKAAFRPVTIGIENNRQAEILDGLQEGEQIVSVGAGAVRRDDTLVIAGQAGPGGPGGRQGMGGRGRSGRGGRGGSEGGDREGGGREGAGREGGGRQMANPGQQPGGGAETTPKTRPQGQRPPQA